MTSARLAGAGLLVALFLVPFGAVPVARGATLVWKGHTWQLTSGAMAGVCKGDPDNVTIDTNGWLHLQIANNGGTWSAAELFTTDKLGFGTYQWQVSGPIDSYDKNVVLGLFSYGPAAGIGADGTDEIDIEYSRWGDVNGPNADWTDYPASGSTQGEMSFRFSLVGEPTTSRFVWSTSAITDFLFSGLASVDLTTGPINTWTYAPSNPTVNIPQQALPLGMNLWCFGAPPSDGNPVEIVIRDFTFVPEGSPTGGAGGAGGGGAGSAGTAGGGAGGRGGAQGGAGTQGGGAAGAVGPSSAGTSGAAGLATGGAGGLAGDSGGSSGLAGATGGASGSAAAGGSSSSPAAGGAAPGGCSCAFGDGSAAGWSVSAETFVLLLALVCRRRRSRARPY
ncbi:MAG TPA: hypothetical protein VMT03_12475 [Polyangia bacterium]|nr:hypothetical protein [Polyangia bacterium]